MDRALSRYPVSRASHRLTINPATSAFATLGIATLLLRFAQLQNPIAGLDEQFYLLVGERMWHGALPYLDLWDRKPVGLFILFAGIAALPGNGVLAANLMAAIAALATAWIIALIARRNVGWVPATMAGIFYLAGLNELWGDTAQSPLFYNLLIAIAALCTLRATVERDAPPNLLLSLTAMLLAGVAIQIKTSAVFQGVAFGLWLLWRTWRSCGPGNAARIALPLMLTGATPSLAAMAGYAVMGHFDAWWQANILSVLAKGAPRDAAAMEMLKSTIVLTAPVGLLSLLGLWAATTRFSRWPQDLGFVLLWAMLAVADFFAIGGYFPHYALPLLLACTPLVARAFALRQFGPLVFALAMLWPAAHALVFMPRTAAADRAAAHAVMTALPADTPSECMFIYEGPVAYYHLSHACLVSRFAFTAHISSKREAHALGIDPGVALRHAMARRPGTVLTMENSTWIDRNPAMEREMAALLKGRYHLAARLPHRYYSRDEHLLMWRRNDL
ncbi:glycosyltransferase family 39 protein [Stakelama sp. CBK3Z-3]|uniref:Glycosyltransferase family 39 protein n=1 Tax=Stakelama flava TaxID=2860338 RepID=A0ABS6XM90_9SPHN|nr:glycosyltransferase family 39 protein [Stakelama flava]MBW4331322.1 glycosyltransferase family 39 protein [Stakelama flava]